MRCLILLLSALWLAGCTGDTAEREDAPPLEQLRGQWVVINYWAQWCKPCIREIPELNELDARYPGVSVLGVNFDGATGEDLALQLDKLGVAFPSLLHDPAAELGIPRPVVLPTTVILDPEGVVRHTLVGPQTLESLSEATGQTPAS